MSDQKKDIIYKANHNNSHQMCCANDLLFPFCEDDSTEEDTYI